MFSSLLHATWVVLIGAAAAAQAQSVPATANPVTAADASSPATPSWRKPVGRVTPAGASSPLDPGAPGALSFGTQGPLQSIGPAPRRRAQLRVTKGPGTLPNDSGQEWRDYDIASYTARVTSMNKPEQAIVDWILRETGYEAWHGEPLGLLSANRRVLRVYHTPPMHAVIAEMVERFISSEAESQAFGLRVVTVDSPNWRAKAHAMLRPVNAQSQGVQAWLLAKEDAALLVADLRRRSDFREHSSPHLLVNNGQSTTVTAMRPRNYVRNVVSRPNAWPGFEPELAQIDEGFSLEFSPLLSLDGKTVDAVIKCNVDQVEKMIPVTLDVPSAVAARQRTKIEVPQMNSCRLHERFRWPNDQVLLISLGVVASPAPKSTNPLNLALPLGNASRCDLLVFVENRGKAVATASKGPAGIREANNYRGRY